MTTRRNRGKQSSDDQLFAEKWHAKFKEAVDDLGFLLSRGYGENSSLQIVGNRYRLNKRQQSAIARISCSQQQIWNRNKSELKANDLKGQTIEIDGFNLLILLESALSGGYIFKGRDGLYRDISSVHGSYKRVVKTEEAIVSVGTCLKSFDVKFVKWYLDQPVSNSGRLKSKLLELSGIHAFNWEVELVFDPDKVLAKGKNIVVSSDGWILDHAERWFNLGAFLIEQHHDKFNVIEV
ncbi:MAG: DUF434 domain-containing protein [Bacteroidota bacterium]